MKKFILFFLVFAYQNGFAIDPNVPPWFEEHCGQSVTDVLGTESAWEAINRCMRSVHGIQRMYEWVVTNVENPTTTLYLLEGGSVPSQHASVVTRFAEASSIGPIKVIAYSHLGVAGTVFYDTIPPGNITSASFRSFFRSGGSRENVATGGKLALTSNGNYGTSGEHLTPEEIASPFALLVSGYSFGNWRRRIARSITTGKNTCAEFAPSSSIITEDCMPKQKLSVCQEGREEICVLGPTDGLDQDGDVIGSFSGTSVASPFVAGMVELTMNFLGSYYTFDRDPSKLHLQLMATAILKSCSVDLGPPGPDPVNGLGIASYRCLEKGEDGFVENPYSVIQERYFRLPGEIAEASSPRQVIADSVNVKTEDMPRVVGQRCTFGPNGEEVPHVEGESCTPSVTIGSTLAGGEIGEALTLNLGESRAVELSLTGFTLSGNETAVFEVSVSGDGLSLQGGTPSSQVLEVSLDAVNVTAGVTVVASESAVSVGELRVRALSGVELSGEATSPIEVLQEVSLSFDPAAVEIQRGRSTEFEVAITPSLVADRRTTVSLAISDQGFGQGFAFGTGRTTRHEVVFDADKSSQTVAVATTAAIDSTASVSVEVTASSGVALATPTSLRLEATTPQVMLRVMARFDSPSGLRLTEHSTGSLTLGLQADGHAYRPVPDQEVVLLVEVKEGDLSVSTDPSTGLAEGAPAVEISLSESSPTATVIIIAGAPGTGVLEVSSDDVELVGDTELPITVRPSSGTTLRIRVFLEGALE